jgi:hypothetical protein
MLHPMHDLHGLLGNLQCLDWMLRFIRSLACPKGMMLGSSWQLNTVHAAACIGTCSPCIWNVAALFLQFVLARTHMGHA